MKDSSIGWAMLAIFGQFVLNFGFPVLMLGGAVACLVNGYMLAGLALGTVGVALICDSFSG